MRVDLIAVTLFVAIGVAAARSWRSRWDAVLLALLSGLWLLANSGFEGPVLWSLDRDHGLTASDLIGLAGLAFAAVALLRPRATHSSLSADDRPTMRSEHR